MKQFSAQQLLNDASAAAGLTDFGEEPFHTDFAFFIECLNNDGVIREDAWEQAHSYIFDILTNRLRMQQDLKDHPEILDTKLAPPVAILSLPRTGTTKLQRLLGMTGNFQNLLYWHCMHFARLPGEPDNGIEKRKRLTQEFEDWARSVVPDYDLGHPLVTEDPEEDLQLMNACFRSYFFPCYFGVPDYAQWVQSTDHAPAFDFLATMYRYLQWQFYPDSEKGWFIKSPGHFGMEAEYERIFPDGMSIICTHRNPAEIVPSAGRTAEIFNAHFIERPERKMLGPWIVQLYKQQADLHMAWRERNQHVRILDLGYKETRDNSLSTAEKVYEFLDIPMTDAVRTEIASWDKKHPSSKYGKKSYNLEDWGATPDMVEEAFADYTERFSAYL